MKNFLEFINESVGTENFIEEAVSALNSHGIEVEITSTPKQILNQNLMCTLTFKKLIEFIEDYYKIDRSQILGILSLDQIRNLEFNLMIYKSGYVQKPESSGVVPFKFSSVDDMAEKTQALIAKEFIKGNTRYFNTSMYKHNHTGMTSLWQVFPNDVKMNKTQDSWLPELAFPKRLKLPSGAHKVLSKMMKEFSNYYDKLSFCPVYLENLTTTLCALADTLVHSPNNNYQISETLTMIKDNSTSTDSLSHISKPTIIKNKVSCKISYFSSIGNANYGTSLDHQYFEEAYRKYSNMSQTELDAYFEDFAIKKRGSIAGKKFGLD